MPRIPDSGSIGEVSARSRRAAVEALNRNLQGADPGDGDWARDIETALLAAAFDSVLGPDPAHRTDNLRRLGQFTELVAEGSADLNLVSRRGGRELLIQLLVDSLAPLVLLPELFSQAPSRAVDVGSGAGFPALPLAILCPGVEFSCVEATAKRAAFLGETCQRLGLSNVVCERARAEDLGRTVGWRDRFDLGFAKAVGSLAYVAEVLLPLD